MVDGIREELGLQSQTFTEVQWLATLTCSLTVEEVTAIELQSHLVAPNLHLAAACRVGQRGIPSVGLGVILVDNPVMVVTLGVSELLIIGGDVLTNAMLLTEIERRILHTKKLAIRNQLVIDGSHVA